MSTTLQEQPATFINEAKIADTLAKARQSSPPRVREVIAKARQLEGLQADEVGVLMEIREPELLEEMFAAARFVKDEIYGNRLVLFAPLYISNLCKNECSYCAFRAANQELKRRVLTQEEIAAEVKILIDQGHKRLLLVAGESYPAEGFNYILKSIETIYKTKSGRGEIRRVNANIAPLTVPQFKQLKDAHIGTFQLFQETYHRGTYAKVHTAGPKKNYDWRVTAFDRAMEAGIDDVGIGVLFGLYDWKFEVLAMCQQIRHLEEHFGVGPHTISVPRMEPAVGSSLAERPPHAVSDADFKKIVAILRLTVPYTGIIMSTRENADTRRATFALGVSQISAGSRCNPGGYGDAADGRYAEQFQLGDHRSLDEVVRDVASLGYTPSFCTACYRLGRTGADFMDLAKPGLIKEHCSPNALSSCMEYLMGYASAGTRRTGENLVDRELATLPGTIGKTANELVGRVRRNERDVFV
ncbi:MAG TPA: [FeFe] hydrogenase H-cluster radical SAM maturase HydG [Candidatus Acidoferrales bacterium]|nr:[FeFe] hydrogenase H-cluster radical SAM maturase HydG [Candidatus Acidoferrales bacterium]